MISLDNILNDIYNPTEGWNDEKIFDDEERRGITETNICSDNDP